MLNCCCLLHFCSCFILSLTNIHWHGSLTIIEHWFNQSAWPLLHTFSMWITKRKHHKISLTNMKTETTFWNQNWCPDQDVVLEPQTICRIIAQQEKVRQLGMLYQNSHNAIFYRNGQKDSVKILYAIIDWLWLGFPKQCIVGYSLTSPIMELLSQHW